MSVIILNKEKNVTSFKAIKDVQKELKFKKAGHGGTLDPLATGILPIFFNSSTRFIEYIANDSKGYVAEFVLGLSSNTEDITGQLEYHPNSEEPSNNDIEMALHSFIGKIKQLAPEYSAKKIKGVPMYKLARKGEKFERREQEIEIRKDKRAKIVGTQQSAMIKQKKNDLTPIDFEDEQGETALNI